jgi:uncharacterized protein
MSIGLIALLDDIAALAKVAASTLDDVAAQATKAGTKAAAVVIDDAAVTPKYVVGLSPNRELPIIFKIAKSSVINKILILSPIALALGYFAPYLITPLLMFGGAYLCYEGAEKIYEFLFPHKALKHEDLVVSKPLTAVELEKVTVKHAVYTDFILSAEIIAISSATVTEAPLFNQAIVLIFVSIFITLGVYGVVALIVKADDVGIWMVKNQSKSDFLKRIVAEFGRKLVLVVPKFLKLLSWVGTLAMLWVGGSIIMHGLHSFGLSAPENLIHHTAELVKQSLPQGLVFVVITWLVTTTMQGILGLILGGLAIPVVEFVMANIIRRKST